MLLDTGFRPSKDGFAFPNTFQDALLGVVPSRGRCGGMVFAALDAYATDRPLSSEARQSRLPEQSAPIDRVIWRRQVESVLTRLGANLWQFTRFTYLPTGHSLGIGRATRRQLLVLFDALRSGRPVPLGLVSALSLPELARNHQVLAYAADFGEQDVVVRVYDPNYPNRDDVTLQVPIEPEAPVVEHAGSARHVWRGFFVEHYIPREYARDEQGGSW